MDRIHQFQPTLLFDGLNELVMYANGLEDIVLTDALLVEAFETTSFEALVEPVKLAIQLLCTQS